MSPLQPPSPVSEKRTTLPSSTSPKAHSPLTTATSPDVGPHEWCVALYDFEAQTPEDLGFTEGEKMEILERVGEEWARGRVGDRQGMFPLGFVQVQPHPGTHAGKTCGHILI